MQLSTRAGHRGAVLRLLVVAAVAATASSALAATARADVGRMTRVSVGSTGAQGSDWSTQPCLSSDGRFVVFGSDARDLVPGDTNGQADAFLHDQVLGTTERVSVSTTGGQGTGPSSALDVTPDGRFVLFHSTAPNLVPSDANGTSDVFLRDRLLGTTERVSVSTAGVEGNGWSIAGGMSSDGRFIAFASSGSNFVAGDTNGAMDIFVRDRANRTTARVSVTAAGAQANAGSNSPTISGDGSVVAFTSDASNLVLGDRNSISDVFTRDRSTGTVTLVSVSSTGRAGDAYSLSPSVSSDGRIVAFASLASSLVAGDTNAAVDIFVRDRAAGTTERVSVTATGGQATGFSNWPEITADGRFVAFESTAGDLDPTKPYGGLDIFVRDRLRATTERVSVSRRGASSDGGSFGYSAHATISGDGRFVGFFSTTSNLVWKDTNGSADVFVYDRSDTWDPARARSALGAVRSSLLAKRAGLTAARDRLWLDHAVESLDWALESGRWRTDGMLAIDASGLEALGALRTSVGRLAWPRPALAEATKPERNEIARVMSLLADARFREAWRQRTGEAPDNFLMWRAERTIDNADADPDRVHATLGYIRLFQMLLAHAPA